MLSPGRAERSFQSDESAAGFPETGRAETLKGLARSGNAASLIAGG
jgi:hypothetical protein